MNEQNKQDIQNVITSFLTEMYEWEINADQKINNGADLSSSEFQETEKEIVRVIYDKYITQKVRKYGLLEDISVGYPPIFNVNIETIKDIEIEKNKAIVTTILTDSKTEKNRQYVLKYIKNQWKIDSIKQFFAYDKKWHSIHI